MEWKECACMFPCFTKWTNNEVGWGLATVGLLECVDGGIIGRHATF